MPRLSRSSPTGIVHRDIKPSNVVLTNAGQVKVSTSDWSSIFLRRPLTSIDLNADTVYCQRKPAADVDSGNASVSIAEQATGKPRRWPQRFILARRAGFMSALQAGPRFPVDVLEMVRKLFMSLRTPPSQSSSKVPAELTALH